MVKKKMKKYIDDVQKKYDDTFIKESDQNIEYIKSPLMNLNYEISGNPFQLFAKGTVIELFGDPGVSKTSLALTILGSNKQIPQNKKVFIDVEHRLNKKYAIQKFNLMGIRYFKENVAEIVFDYIREVTRLGVQLIVVDSIAALSTMAEIQNETGASNMGILPKMFAQFYRKLNKDKKNFNEDVVIIFLNQYKMRIGLVFGDPRYTPGGKASEFHTDYRLELSTTAKGKVEVETETKLFNKDSKKDKKLKKEIEEQKKIRGVKKENRKKEKKEKSEKRQIGTKVRIKVFKNLYSMPFAKFDILLRYGEGFSRVYDLYSLAKRLKILKNRTFHKFKSNKNEIKKVKKIIIEKYKEVDKSE